MNTSALNTLVLAPFSSTGLAELRKLGSVTYEPWPETQTLWDPEELGARLEAEGFGGLVVEIDFVFEELFSTASSLRFAAICRAALNQVDVDAATDAGVVVVHTPGRNAQAVAELVLAHLLNLARHIPTAASFVASGAWEDPTEAYTRFQGRELAGSTLGLVGVGQIGKRVARLAWAVGMRVLAYDPYVAKAPAGVTLATLDELLAASDFVSLHVPENDETLGWLDAGRIALIKPTAYVINVTSPAVVDSVALASALREGRLAGAAMDVHASHPIAPDSPFLGLQNVTLTPHIGGATAETIERHSAMVVEDLARYVGGRRPKRLANPAVWPRRKRA